PVGVKKVALGAQGLSFVLALGGGLEGVGGGLVAEDVLDHLEAALHGLDLQLRFAAVVDGEHFVGKGGEVLENGEGLVADFVPRGRVGEGGGVGDHGLERGHGLADVADDGFGGAGGGGRGGGGVGREIWGGEEEGSGDGGQEGERDEAAGFHKD